MEKLIKAALIAWNPFMAVNKRKGEGKLSFEDVLIPFLGVVVACKLVEFEAMHYWLKSFFDVQGLPLPKLPSFFSSEFAQQYLAVFGTLFPIGFIFLLPKSTIHPHKASSIAAAILIITSSFTFYSSTILSAFYVLSGSILQTNPAMAQNLLSLSVIAAFAIVPIAAWIWSKILLSELCVSKTTFTLITVSYILGIVILSIIIGAGSGEF